ncbi:MAG TPA: DUF2911 domain-containing protein [Gemmatimonadaceae bacterium]|nr:DUF2911 domain-containing protein [Gemmatimonadaceae bacterium]
MKPLTLLVAFLAAAACARSDGGERYGFAARLGNDTVSLESVTRHGNTLTSDEVDRFPILRKRHTVVTLGPAGEIRRLVMEVYTPSEPANQRDRKVVADVGTDSVIMTKRDGATNYRWAFATRGGTAMAHVPQMYSLYELYLDAALARGRRLNVPVNDTVQMRQFYIDREFDRFPLHRGIVWDRGGGKLEIAHDWLSGIAEATLDSNGRLVGWNGHRTTYQVNVERLATPPNVDSVAARWTAHEASTGVRQLSVRDTMRASIGKAALTVDYSRPLARGRTLLGDVIAYDRVWRTGANAATQFSTTAPITLAGIRMPAGTYTLWTLPHQKGADLIVNNQFGQWGTSYDASRDIGKAPLQIASTAQPVEAFTISVQSQDARRGTLVLEWGPFRWTAPIVVP